MTDKVLTSLNKSIFILVSQKLVYAFVNTIKYPEECYPLIVDTEERKQKRRKQFKKIFFKDFKRVIIKIHYDKPRN